MSIAADRDDDLSWTVDQAMVDAWAELSRDANPLHVDPEFARSSRFGATIAHGHMTVAMLMEQLAHHCGRHIDGGAVIRGIRFLAPVYTGERYTSRIEAREDGLRLSILDERGHECVIGLARVSCIVYPCPQLVSAATPADPPSIPANSPPLLWADDLSVGQVFAPVRIACTTEIARRYAEIVGLRRGVSTPCMPGGFAAAMARWSYLANFSMPPGAVLLGMDVRLRSVPPVGDALVCTSRVTAVHERKNLARDISIVTEMYSSADAALRVRLNLRWPRLSDGNSTVHVGAQQH